MLNRTNNSTPACKVFFLFPQKADVFKLFLRQFLFLLLVLINPGLGFLTYVRFFTIRTNARRRGLA